MTRPALVALIGRGPALPEAALRRFEGIARAEGLAQHRLGRAVVIAIAGPAGVRRDAALVGHAFAMDGHAPADPAAAWPARPGTRPPQTIWGDYLTVVAPPAGAAIARAPFGALPCFWIEEEGAVLVASSLPLLRTFARERPTVDWSGLATFLLSPQMRGQATCLQGVRELPGGCCLEILGAATAVRHFWSPWPFACPERPLATRGEAVEAVGRAVDGAVAARCGLARHPVLLLSGGLDSSTLAAVLAHAGQPFSALTMVTRQKGGDERVYARAVAERSGARLTECLRSTRAIDWADTTPGRLPRPSARVFRQPTLAAAARRAAEVGTDTILDGGGGDNLFCSLQSVAPLLDRWAIEGPGRGVWTTACDTALRADVSVAAVLSKAVRRRASGRIAFRWPTDASFLSGNTRKLTGAVSHPWLDPPPGALPGQAAHVALVLDAVGLAEDDSTCPAVRTLSPLVAQPIVEAVLRVRSWLWFERGRNRAVIRRAYADRLPAAVVERTGKGTPMGFMGEVVEAHRAQLRELLLGGVLVAQDIADAEAIDAALSPATLPREQRYAQLLILADAERWARSWR